MKKVKICGITNYEDAILSVQAGADALGFVFYKKSPRYITPKNAFEIIKELPPFIENVGLFVEVSAKEVNEIALQSGISLAQIHFEPKDNNFYNNLNINHIKVIRAQVKDDIKKFENEYRLVDAMHHEYGGVGKRVNLELFDDIDTSKIILAGGLSAHNIKELDKYNFYGVDVSSSVEISKGKKDIKKVEEFIKIAKNYIK